MTSSPSLAKKSFLSCSPSTDSTNFVTTGLLRVSDARRKTPWYFSAWSFPSVARCTSLGTRDRTKDSRRFTRASNVAARRRSSTLRRRSWEVWGSARRRSVSAAAARSLRHRSLRTAALAAERRVRRATACQAQLGCLGSPLEAARETSQRRSDTGSQRTPAVTAEGEGRTPADGALRRKAAGSEILEMTWRVFSICVHCLPQLEAAAEAEEEASALQCCTSAQNLAMLSQEDFMADGAS